MRRSVCVVLAVCLAWSAVTHAEDQRALRLRLGRVASIVAGAAHPRIWITSSTLASVKTELATGGAHNARYNVFVDYLDDTAQYDLSPSACAALTYPCWNLAANYAHACLTFQASAGISYAHTQAEYCTRAKDILLGVRTAYSNTLPGGSLWDLYILGVAYDWVYPYLNATEVGQITSFLATFDTGSNTQVPFNAAAVIGRSDSLIYGLAIAGDNAATNTWASAQVASYSAWFRGTNGITAYESFFSGEDGNYTEGNSYAIAYTTNYVLAAEEAYRTAYPVLSSTAAITTATHYGGSDAAWIRAMPDYWTYNTMPYGFSGSTANGWPIYKTQKQAAAIPLGTLSNFNSRMVLNMGALRTMLATADSDAAGLARWYLENRLKDPEAGTGFPAQVNEMFSWVFGHFVGRPLPTIKTPSDVLPTSRAFASGVHFMWSGWNTSVQTDAVVTFHATKWWMDAHFVQLFPGHFTVDRKGPQIVKAGSGGHDWGYGAGAANSLLFPDRSVDYLAAYTDDAGGPRINTGSTSDSDDTSDFTDGTFKDVRGVLRSYMATGSRDADHIYADLTPAYSSDAYHDAFNASRISAYSREFTHFPGSSSTSERIIVFDRATATDTKYHKEWWLRFAQEPTVTGGSGAALTRNGHSDGHTEYTGTPTLVTMTNTTDSSSGLTTVTPLLPASRTIVKAGGPNVNGNSWVWDAEVGQAASITASANVCTLTATKSTGIEFIGETITVSGASPSAFNVTGASITPVGPRVLTYPCSGATGTATGTPLFWASSGARINGGGKTITSLTASSGTCTADTSTAHNIPNGGTIHVTGVTPHAFNVLNATATRIDADTLTYACPGATGSGSSNGGMIIGEPQSHEYENPYGTFLPTQTAANPGADRDQYAGRYHIEISAATESATDYFLVCVEVGNAGSTANACSGISTGSSTWVGAVIGDRAAVYHKTSTAATSGSFTLPAAFSGKLLIADLTGTRTITATNVTGTITNVDGGANCASGCATTTGLLYLNIVTSASSVVTIN